jgi:transcriptional regulator with XRE-family HTH domain
MTEKTVEKARQMIHDLLILGFSGAKIAKGTGITEMTISSIKNGKSQRVSEKVFDKLWNFFDETAPPRAEMERIRSEKAPATEAPNVPAKQSISGTAEPDAPKPKRKYTKRIGSSGEADSSTKVTFPNTEGFINRQLVPVDLSALNNRIDHLIAQFSEALKQLHAIRKQID